MLNGEDAVLMNKGTFLPRLNMINFACDTRSLRYDFDRIRTHEEKLHEARKKSTKLGQGQHAEEAATFTHEVVQCLNTSPMLIPCSMFSFPLCV